MHSELQVIERLRYCKRLFTLVPRRYKHILQTVYRGRAKRLLEIGTFDGSHGTLMIQTAAIFHSVDDIKYSGFDLFEALTDDDLELELSKRPPARDVVEQKLIATGASVRLFQGYTHETLPRYAAELPERDRPDFVFVGRWSLCCDHPVGLGLR